MFAGAQAAFRSYASGHPTLTGDSSRAQKLDFGNRRPRAALGYDINMRTVAAPGSRYLKVDHAGEHGAVSIYAGQILMARVTAPDLVPELREFRGHEIEHRERFRAELRRRGVRRCRSYWLCGAGGFVLGLTTGLFGRQAIAATTVAVERVVLRHLADQIEILKSSDAAAAAVISTIVEEEQQHHDESASHLKVGGFWDRLLSPVVSASTESVIWIGLRI